MIREIYTRFGREGLGFAWIIGEPLIFAIPVLLMWSLVRAPTEHGMPLVPLLWSGYLPLLLFRHIGGRSLLFIRANVSLLYHRPVTLLDVFVARSLVEVVSNIVALIVVFLMFYMLGEIEMPRDLPRFYLGYFFTIWWCLAIGLFIGALSERTDWAEKIWQPYSYTYIFWGGSFFMADWLPKGLRDLALYQPSVQAYEIIRGGLFGDTVRTYGDPVYTTVALLVFTFFGLWALREGRKYVSII